MSPFRPFWLLLLFLAASAFAHNPPPLGDPDNGMEGSMRLGIPEPMIFDLVRPLGAAKGEFEVNSLVHAPLRREPFRWAPEVEYAFRKGSAIEFELPLEARHLDGYKAAIQTTLPMRPVRRITHGLQGIGEIYSQKRGWEATGLYLFGVRWSRNWSTLSMGGAAYHKEHAVRFTSPLVNHSVFYERFQKAALGVEWNARDWRRSKASMLVVPQVHLRVSRHVNLQVGAGRSWHPGERTPIASWRLIRQF